MREEFETWWEKHGQYCRAGGGQYEKTFAWAAWQAARAVPDWQPIATAPKDGTEILAYREDAGCFLARWTCCYSFMTDTECEQSDMDDEELASEDWFCADFIAGDRLEGDLVPTHWMPLPAAPIAREGE